MNYSRQFIVLICAVLLISTLKTNAQKLPFRFGKVKQTELEMSYCKFDTTASAVVLGEYCSAFFDYKDDIGFTIVRETVHKIKIFDKEGYDQANFTISLWKNNTEEEKLSKIKGHTYNLENGKIVKEKLKNDGIFKEEVHDNLDKVKVTMPKVREGSVIELTYTIVSEFFFDFHTWYFQHDIPTLWSEYNVAIPEYFVYNKSHRGYIPLFINESDTDHKIIQINEKNRTTTGGG